MAVHVVVLCGLADPWAVGDLGPTAVVHWDGSGLVGGAGVVLRWQRGPGLDPLDEACSVVLALQHPCLACAVREDLVPAVLATGAPRVVVALPPGLEPKAALRALAGAPGIELERVVTTVDARTWLEHVTHETPRRELGWQLVDDDAGDLGTVFVRQLEQSNVVHCSHLPSSVLLDLWAHLAPDAHLTNADLHEVLVTPGAGPRPRPGWWVLLDEHDGTLRDLGAARVRTGDTVSVLWRARCALHPERLHEAIATVTAHTIRSRGMIWLPARPDQRLAWDQAGGELQLAREGTWIAAGGPETWLRLSDAERAWCDAHWDLDHGDRMQELCFTGLRSAGFDPDAVLDALRECLIPHEDGCTAALLPDPFAEHLA